MTMSVATLDDTLLPILESARERVVVRTKSGRVLGYFQPTSDDGYVRQSPYSEDEVRAIQQNKGECLPLAEFWKRMGGPASPSLRASGSADPPPPAS
jgi:hypothetical protein